MNSKTFVAIEEVDWDFEKLGVTKEQLDEMQSLGEPIGWSKDQSRSYQAQCRRLGGTDRGTHLPLYKARESGELKVKLNVIKRKPDQLPWA